MIDWQDLRRRSLQATGFAEDRIHIWPRLLGVDPARLKPQPAWSELPPHHDENQIKLDTDRSFVLYPYTTNDRHRARLQSDLHELIVSVFRKRPKLNYFQGYHDIVSVLLLTLPPELQLACAEKLSLHRLRDSMGNGLEPVLGLLRVTKNLIKLADPELSSMLDQSSQLPFFALSNLLTLFAHDTPTLPLIQHVFDYLLCRPPIAVVYLAAAITLERKDEVRRLQEEDEDGMIHSLLSSLPRIIDDDAPPRHAPEIGSSPKPGVSTHEGPAQQKNSEPHTTPSPSPDGADPDHTLVTSPSPERTQDFAEEETDVEGTPFSPPPESDLTLVDTPEPFISQNLENDNSKDQKKRSTTSTTLMNDLELIETEEEQTSNAISTATPPQSPETTSLTPKLPASSPTPNSVDPPLESPSSSTPSIPPVSSTSPTPASTPAPPALTLTSLLKSADNLYDLYPPTHPSLHLSSIMGPQSVIYTWSENFHSWPSDTLAENMVSRPELVVYPHIPSDASDSENGSSEDESEDYSKAKGRSKHKLRKSSGQYKKAKEKEEKKRRRKERKGRESKRHKLNIGPPGLGIGVGVEKKAMVAGAVVVLGIAMAVYGVKGGPQQSPSSPLSPVHGGGGGMFGGTGFRGLLKSASGMLDYFTH